MHTTCRQAAACLLLATLLAACSGGTDSPPAAMPAPASVQSSAVRSTTGATVFSGNLSQYTIDRTALTVTDNVSGSVRPVAARALLSFADTVVALDLDGNPGQAYRLYQAAFRRVPDLPGLGFQIHALELGFSLEQIAQGFIDSKEFSDTYGALDDTAFVTLLYNNVLGRAPDAAGLAFHVGYLQGTHPGGLKLTRAAVLQGFSESPENKALVLPAISKGIEYTVFGTTAPSNPVSEFVASYNGSLGGADTGTVSLVVTSDGAITAAAHSNAAGADLQGSGTIAAGGKFGVTATGAGRSLVFTGSINLANGLATGSWQGSGGDAGVFNAARVSTTPSFAQVRQIITARCVACHSATPTLESSAPLGILFDTETQIRARALDINRTAVLQQTMPLGNVTGMSSEERALIGKWFNAGRP